MHKKLALLVCDTPMPSVLSKHGDYVAIYNTWLLASLPPDSNASYTMDSFDVVHKQEYPPDEKEYDGILLTGSAASAYQKLEWIDKLVGYIAYIAEHKPQTKIIGICFGHQIVARAFGGECVPNGGKWELAITEIALTDTGKEVFGVPTLNIQQMHRDHVPGVPVGLQLIGSTTNTYNQGMVKFSDLTSQDPPASGKPRSLKDVHVLTVEGHPEYTSSIVSLMVTTRSQNGIIDAASAKDAMGRVDLRNDGVTVIGKVVWQILGVEFC